MELKDNIRIDAPRAQVFAALNDPEVLKASIPGCDSLEKVSDSEFAAQVTAKVGPVKAKFKGVVHLSDLVPPESYRISGEGKGGAAGFAKGGADIQLAEDAGATILTYTVKADVGGKLAQLGGRLIEGTSKKLAAEFFQNFQAALVTSEAGECSTETPSPAVTEPQAQAPLGTASSYTGSSYGGDAGARWEKVLGILVLINIGLYAIYGLVGN